MRKWPASTGDRGRCWSRIRLCQSRQPPPDIVQLDPYPLLFHARDSAFERLEDSEANRRKGWQRISLFAFYFRPQALEIAQLGPSLQQAIQAPDHSPQAYFGWFPFRWQPDWLRSFEALRGGGRGFVAPILQTLILNRAPEATITWANRVASWEFERIIPCHFDAPLAADPRQFRQAFSFLEKQPPSRSGLAPAALPQEDFALLQELEASLNRWGITPPRPGKDLSSG